MNTKKQGFLQALGVTFYCALVGVLFWQGNVIFPQMNPYFGPVMMLLLLSCSVLICALIVFYRPCRLFFSGKKTEAIGIVLATTFWLFLSLILFFGLLLILG